MSYRVAVAVSGRGSNLLALIDALDRDRSAAVHLVLADRDAEALHRARERGVPTHRLADFRDAAEWLNLLTRHGIDLLVLAGYLRLLPAALVAAWRGRIINVHPALLPRHGGRGMHGMHVHEAVLAAGDPESGATVHLVDEVYDSGAVLAQARIPVTPGMTPQELAAAVLTVEHQLLPIAVRTAAQAGRPVPFQWPDTSAEGI